jgi:hypothetical protein
VDLSKIAELQTVNTIAEVSMGVAIAGMHRERREERTGSGREDRTGAGKEEGRSEERRGEADCSKTAEL